MTPAEKNAAVTAAPRALTLGERTFLLAPPALSDSTTIAVEGRRLLAARESPLSRLVRDAGFAKLPSACQVAATQEAVRAQLDGSKVSGMDLAFELSSPPLLTFAIWLLARRLDSALKLEEIRSLVTEDNAGEVFVRFVQASGLLDLDKDRDPFPPGPSG
jgi:hypothetical protein